MDEELVALSECICTTVDLITNRNHSAPPTEPDPDPDPDAGQNVTSFDYCASQGSAASNDPLRRVEELLFTRVVVVICALGVAGNVGNLLVLVPQGRRCAKGRIERSVYWGLVSLAVSDLFFCLTVIPKAFTERDPFVSRPDFSLAYAVYGDGLINVFVMASTWLTVAMAVGRYLAVCHPFRARQVIGTTLTKRAVFAVYATCFACNAPRFFVYRAASIVCGQPPVEEEFHFRWPGYVNVRRNPTVETVYMWSYFAVGVFLPCVLLSVSNAFLIRALHGADAALRSSPRRRSSDSTGDQYRPITVTLVALVAMYVILVSPAEIVIFMRHRFVAGDVTYGDTYDLVAAVGNTLQAVNFSLNFVLYYVINAHFRRALSELVRGRCRRRRRRHSFGASLSLTGSVSLNNVRRHRLTGYKMAELPVDSSPEIVSIAAVQAV